MANPELESPSKLQAAAAEDIRAVLGNLDEAKMLELLDLKPTVAEVEEAAVWFAGDGDVLGREGKPMNPVVARLFDILTRDEWPEER